jgi:hypothetical protein
MTTILFRKGLRLFASLSFLLFLNTRCDASELTTIREVTGVFFNVGNGTVQLNVRSADKKDTTIMTLSSGQVGSTATVKGEVRVLTPSKNMTSGHLLSSCQVPDPEAAPEFFEKTTRMFYFRIDGGKVTLVKPRDLSGPERRRVKAYLHRVQNG